MQQRYKYLGLITCLYITFQLVSDVTAGKIINFFGFPVSVTVIYFPITFIFGDILTEVYGYARARGVLWIVMCCSIIAGLLYIVMVNMPPAHGFDANDAYNRVFGTIPRIIVGGWLAVFVGNITNDFVMAKMKIWTKGKMLWTRTIGSTIAGEGVNTGIFYLIGLYGIIPNNLLFESILTGWVLKTIVEVVFTPVTYFVVGKLKKVEKEDFYDNTTNFNPFIFKSPF
jgi:uncharacterized integral membrane protein (TIGR00697 family)